MSGSATPVDFGMEEPLPVRLRRFREQSGISRSELAERTGLSRPTIWAWESGKTQPRQSNLQTLAHALGVPESELVGDAYPAQRSGIHALVSSEWEQTDIPLGLANASRLRIMIYAAKLGIAAIAGIKARNVKISIEL